MEHKEFSRIHGRSERPTDVRERPTASLSDVKNSVFSWAGDGGSSPPWGSQGAQSPVLDNKVTDSAYIIYILHRNFPETFHALSCYLGQDCGGFGGWGGGRARYSIHLDSREREESICTKIVVIR